MGDRLCQDERSLKEERGRGEKPMLEERIPRADEDATPSSEPMVPVVVPVTSPGCSRHEREADHEGQSQREGDPFHW